MHLWLLTDFFSMWTIIYWFPPPYSRRRRWSWLITHLSTCTLLHPHTPHLPFSFLIFLRPFIPILTKSRVFMLLWLQKRLLSPVHQGEGTWLQVRNQKRFLEGVTDWIDFPGGQAVETPRFHNSWCGFDLWLGNWDPTKFFKIKLKKKRETSRLSLK